MRADSSTVAGLLVSRMKNWPNWYFLFIERVLHWAALVRLQPLRGGLGEFHRRPQSPTWTRADETAKLSRGVSVSYATRC